MDQPTAPWYTQLHWQALIALAAGAVVGSTVPSLATAAGFLGDLFLRLLRMVIVPLVLLTALMASVGAAGIPMAGLVMLVVVLEAVGLPLEGIGTIIAVDRVLDMLRSSTNVWSDLVGSAVVARFEGSGNPPQNG